MVTSSDVFWWWADSDGSLRTVSQAELQADLSAGRIPARTLVWQAGWLSWMRASQVPGLREQLPEYAREHVAQPKLGPASDVPPRLPTGVVQAGTAVIPPTAVQPGGATGPIVPVASEPVNPSPPRSEAATPASTPIAPASNAIVPVESAPDHELDGPTRIMAPIQKLPSWGAEVDAEIARANAPAPVSYAFADTIAPPPQPKSNRMGWLLAAGGVMVLGVLGVAGAGAAYWYSTTKQADRASAAKPVAPPAPPPATPAPQACKLSRGATRIAESVEPGVPPYLSASPGSDKVVVGVAESAHSALGVSVDPKTLSHGTELSRLSTGRTLGVVPVTAGGKIDFVVDSAEDRLAFQRTVDAKQRFQIGLSREGVARVVDNGDPELLWPLDANTKLTEPRVGSLPDGHALSFRAGGAKGKLHFGWLTADGAKASNLFTLSVSADKLGTPNVAADSKAAVVSFSAQRNNEWRVMLARAERGAGPAAAIPFDLPSGGPGGDAISPAIASLGDGRWLLQWTEGSGERKVRAQTLDSELAAIGEPITLSRDGANSGQGEIWSDGTRALSVFLVRSAAGYELWASSLDCE